MAWRCYNCGKSNVDEMSKCIECSRERIILNEKKIEQENKTMQTKTVKNDNNSKDNNKSDRKNNWIGNLSVIIAFTAMILPLVFNHFDFVPTIGVLAIIAGISLFIGKVLNPENGFLTLFIILSIIMYFIPVYVIWSLCNNCSG